MSGKTEWIDPNVRPVRKGVYEVHMFLLGRAMYLFAYWTGKYWCLTSGTVAEANVENNDKSSDLYSAAFKGWRGLANKPKVK